MWTKYLIIKLLCYFCVKVNWKETSSQTSACAAGERPRAYNLSHVPQLIHPAVFRHQTSLEVSGSAETVSCTSSATRFCTKHNSTHTKEKKKKNKTKHLVFSGIYKYLPQFSRSLQNQLQKLTAHYVQTLGRSREEPSRGTVTQHPWSARSALLQHRSCPAQCRQ